jgi:hypothetical protein
LRSGALVVLVLAALVAAAAPAAAHPRCFGAAARDSRHPSKHAGHRVTPTPNQAPLIPNVPCRKLRVSDAMSTCELATPASRAKQTVALIGDSHAQHLRPGIDYVAKKRRWHLVDITVPHCLLTTTPSGIGPPFPTLCPRWDGDVIAWLAAHPQVHTIVLAGNALQPITRPPGVTAFDARVDGILERWQELPASVTTMIVIRDSPRIRYTTPACVTKAIKRHRNAATACALPRRWALPPDPMLEAARRQTARTAQIVDLSRYMCGARRCFPVVGGVLVHRDDSHLTKLFARTLGPYIDRAVGIDV